MQHNSSMPAINGSTPVPVRLHGVLVRVFGAGILLIGESGIGKSECALELISRGHRLVADDAVDVIDSANGLVGNAPETTANLLEIRGLGVINVARTFGSDAVLPSSSIDLCVELKKGADGPRVGNFIYEEAIAGKPVPRFTLPVTPGRNLAVLVETATRILLNRHHGAAAGDDLLAAAVETESTGVL